MEVNQQSFAGSLSCYLNHSGRPDLIKKTISVLAWGALGIGAATGWYFGSREVGREVCQAFGIDDTMKKNGTSYGVLPLIGSVVIGGQLC